MDNSSDLGKFTVHGQLVLELNLSGRLTPDDAENWSRSIGNALSPTLKKLLEETQDGSGARQIEVLCSGRIWRPDGQAALSSYTLQLSPMSQSGWHEIEARRTAWHSFYDC